MRDKLTHLMYVVVSRVGKKMENLEIIVVSKVETKTSYCRCLI